jgi:signal transduction histidine kinase
MIEELTTEILTAEKQAYGKIIRMMAHEVNNSIGAVNSILNTLLKFHSTEPEYQHSLEVAVHRNDHLNQFMKKFADLVRLAPAQKERLELNEMVSNVTQLMEFKARESRIVFQYEWSPLPVPIYADSHQMEQVLINIIKNAMESIVQKNDTGPRFIKFITRYKPKQLIIEDNGQGISEETQPQLFSPFFTTKRDGQGIGLTVIREILMNHGFLYSLMTQRSGVTSFVIHFPESKPS